MKVVIVAGGTGGHIFPAISLAEEFKKRDNKAEILFIGIGRKLEEKTYKKGGHGYYEKLFIVRMPSFQPKDILILPFILKYVIFFIKFTAGFLKAIILLFRFKPNVVVGFGGYVCVPVMLAGLFLRVPMVLHEQNVLPGQANRFLAPFVDKVAISFEKTGKALNAKSIVFTGNPIRNDILKGDRPSARKRLGIEEDRFTILVMGGSQGSNTINRVMIEAIILMSPEERTGLHVLHLSGKNGYEWVKREYTILEISHTLFPFLDDMGDAYKASNLVIARAGATTIAEITASGLPGILVPYPHARMHQVANASLFEEFDAGIMIEEKRLSGGILKSHILELKNDTHHLKRMSRNSRGLANHNGDKRLADEVIKVAKKV